MTVTAIERGGRLGRGIITVTVDGSESFGLHEEILLKYGLRKGDEIDEETIRAITGDEERLLARRKAAALLRRRLRSEHELRTRLIEEEFSPAVIDELLTRLRDAGILNDAAFARAFVHDAELRRPAGERLLRGTLRRKGIGAGLIDDVLAGRNERARALEAARKRLKRIKPGSDGSPAALLRTRKRLADFLLRRGFAWPVISAALRELLGGGGNEAEREET